MKSLVRNRRLGAKRFALLLTGFLLGLPGLTSAQDYPAKPVKIIVSFAAGGQLDVIARLVTAKLRATWGQAVIIENRPGAGGNISAEIVAKSPADGYTLYGVTQAFAVNAATNPSKAFDPARDFAPIALLGSARVALIVSPSLPVNSIGELVTYAKRQPDALNYAATSIGSSAHLGMELFKRQTGIEAQLVPYVNVAQITPDIMTGRVSLWLTTLSSAISQVNAGQLRAFGITGEARIPALPNIPTFRELGYPDFEVASWYSLLAPAGTPAAIVSRINRDVRQALDLPDIRERLDAMGVEPIFASPEEARTFVQNDIDRWIGLVKAGVVKTP